ncbi:MAG: hypothetical protein A2X34_03260 [Elusimicrobia bacterium GWC2_51_8]|nr:MAG: hypothetical protein A2X33_07040 [Elusimicrobia bacterium GWA2_51_34]OGR58326.1 MAG: hypothetical protein A2X34_03260 [Elusimicrobia bacterium GWC2_51_8]OGR87211.1 MAG: hypothetical protein A2021_08250 [Elusimicrobia bacterium GWF2_52_66]HAF95930.1 hypothetical protein [Elusimicrobiota bacterium]HCE97387.1 hypothetical protein [Elusimicrobiota bacterium]
MNNYRIDKAALFNELSAWSGFLKKPVRLIACGGTAMTLLNIKASTKDVDFIVPETAEYKYLAGKLADLGYRQATKYGWCKGDSFVFDLYPGNRVYETELLASPLELGGHSLCKEFERIYVGILNYYDILITKLFRSSSVDIEDCLGLVRVVGKEIDLKVFEDRFRQTAAYDTSEEKVLRYLEHFLGILRKKGII